MLLLEKATTTTSSHRLMRSRHPDLRRSLANHQQSCMPWKRGMDVSCFSNKMPDGLKSVHIRRAPAGSGKKFVAELRLQSGRVRRVRFGDSTMQDFTQHHDPARRARYIQRHRAREHWSNPQTAGFWSRWLLWGASTSLRQNARAIARTLDIPVRFQ